MAARERSPGPARGSAPALARRVTDADDVEQYFPLVRYVIGGMLSRGQLRDDLELEDVEAVGRAAAWEALCRWEPAKGQRSTFLYSCVWGSVMHYQRDVSKALGWSRTRGETIASVGSLDAPLEAGSERTLFDVVADEATSDGVDALIRRLCAAAARLSARERIIAVGMLNDAAWAETACRLGVKQVSSRMIAAVRGALADELDLELEVTSSS